MLCELVSLIFYVPTNNQPVVAAAKLAMLPADCTDPGSTHTCSRGTMTRWPMSLSFHHNTASVQCWRVAADSSPYYTVVAGTALIADYSNYPQRQSSDWLCRLRRQNFELSLPLHPTQMAFYLIRGYAPIQLYLLFPRERLD